MPQDERVAGKARVNVPGGSVEPVGDGFRDRGPLVLAPVGELARRPPRSTDTKDLSASLRSDGRCGGVGRVLNLCVGGMLLESSSDLEVAETVGFELVGRGFRYAGRAAVAHRQDGAIGPSLAGTVRSSVLSASWSLRDCAGNSWDRTILARWASRPRGCRILAGMIAQRSLGYRR
jgi:hypothetical protein